MTQKTPTTILIVDDEYYIRDILSRWLAEEGYHCVTAANADEALKLLTENDFSLMLLDIMMPEKSGIGLLHRVRERHLDITILMISALDHQKLFAGTLELGAYGYLTKPFEKDEIVTKVAGAMEHRGEMLLARQKSLEEEVRELKAGEAKRRRARGRRQKKEPGEHR